MKNSKLYILLIWLFIVSCEGGDSIHNSKWENKMGDCLSYLHFITEKDYEYFDCELVEKFYGSYTLRNDTILIRQSSSEYDSEFKEDSRHKSSPEKFKLLMAEDTIRFFKKWNSTSKSWKNLSKEGNVYILSNDHRANQ